MATSPRPSSSRRRVEPEPPLEKVSTTVIVDRVDSGRRDPKLVVEAMVLLGKETRYQAAITLGERHGFSRYTARGYIRVAERQLAPHSEKKRDQLRSAVLARLFAAIDGAMADKDYTAIARLTERITKLFGLDAAPERPRILDGFFGREAPAVIDMPTDTAENKLGSAAPLTRAELRELREMAALAAAEQPEDGDAV